MHEDDDAPRSGPMGLVAGGLRLLGLLCDTAALAYTGLLVYMLVVGDGGCRGEILLVVPPFFGLLGTLAATLAHWAREGLKVGLPASERLGLLGLIGILGLMALSFVVSLLPAMLLFPVLILSIGSVIGLLVLPSAWRLGGALRALMPGVPPAASPMP